MKTGRSSSIGRAGICAVAWALSVALAGVAAAADGTVLKVYAAGAGMQSTWIKGIFRDGDRVLVATTAGTSVFDPAEKRFVPFAPGPGFKGARVTGWADFGGKTYAGSEIALNVREGGKWTSLDRFHQVRHNEELLVTDGKVLYALARVMFGGVLRFDGKDWAIVDRGAGTGIMNNATALLKRGDELFIGTTTNGLYHFDGKAWKVLLPENGLPGVWVTSLAQTDEGVWVGCFNGLALYDGEKFRRFGAADGLPSEKISALKVVNGKLLVGTMDKGLSIRAGNLFVNVGTEQGLSDNRVEAIEGSAEGAWVGTVNGLNLVEVR